MGSNAGTILTVQNNDTVSVNYVGSLQNGQVFDTSIQSEAQKAGLPARPSYSPLEFKVGAGQVIKGFNDGVIGMKIGDEKIVTIPAAQAYGEVKQENIAVVNRSAIDIQGAGNITIGSVLTANDGTPGIVTAVTNETVTVDFNHQLAGKTLVFKITLVNLTRR